MSRNLLPRLREKANIVVAQEGGWTVIDSPAELAKLEYAAEDAGEFRTRIQSIPNPWARMLLFKAAMEDPEHPARVLVENEILDTLEFIWTHESLKGVTLEARRVKLGELKAVAEQAGSPRVEAFADALVRLSPRGPDREPVVGELTVGLVTHERPVFASSPYTLIFSAEDAAGAETSHYFRYAAGAKRQQLVERPRPFQRYVAQVLLPQLSAMDGGSAIQQFLLPWLRKEVQRCASAHAGGVSEPDPSRPWDWASAATALGLEPISGQFAGITLHRRPRGQEVQESPWLLRARKSNDRPPLVLDAELFDGVYYDGAPEVRLPDSLKSLDRDVLPGLGQTYPWVNPALDWFTSHILLLNQPLKADAVYGLENYRWQGDAADQRFGKPRLAIPLRAAFFRYYRPEDVDEMLRIQVLPSGRIEATLTVEVGNGATSRKLTIRRTYSEADIRREAGPGLAVWPSFHAPAWPHYVVFRLDSSTQIARHLRVDAIVDGDPLANDPVRRSPLAEVSTFMQPPEAFEVLSTASGDGPFAEPLGMVIPRYQHAEPIRQASWQVGIDFGTSNTVVSIRENDDDAGRILSFTGLTLPLTEPSLDSTRLMDAYFFPLRVEDRPFGTAVVHLKSLLTLDVAQEPLGGRVNVPFSGHVDGLDNDGYNANEIVGDLKWSAAPHAYFLSASFLRHLVASILASAVQTGVHPGTIRFSWAYPRAFTMVQREHLAAMWEGVVRLFEPLGLALDAASDRKDESQSVLRYFFNLNVVAPTGNEKVILDIGGGTTDIAVYGRGRVRLLDSVLLGGRNLAGPRRTAATRDGDTNPFVRAFAEWALKAGNLPPENASPVRAYINDRQVHLAFSYLVSTPWFAEGKAGLFTARPEFHAFQQVIFYFFGTLFYYTGLAFRAISEQDGAPVLPRSVVLAGNGSRFLDWLTDLRPLQNNPFHAAFARILAAGAGAGPDVRLPDVVRSETPKLEVALGLVAKVNPTDFAEGGAILTPVVGEAIGLRGLDGSEARAYTATSCFGAGERIDPENVRRVLWGKGELEIERFHRALVEAAQAVSGHGAQWGQLASRYQQVFDRVERTVEDDARARLEYLVQQNQSFSGSIFMLEASIVMEHLLDELFAAQAP